MPTHQATALAGMPFANSTEDGQAIVFALKGQDDSEQKFACTPNAIPEIVARLLGALGQAATLNEDELQAVVVQKSEIRTGEDDKQITLVLCPTPNCPIGFSLDPGQAQKISTGLAHAAAILDPAKPEKLH